MGMPPFHLAFAVRDLSATRYFYVNRLGCKVGRTNEKWIDFNFFGHQISAHLKPEETQRVETNGVDGKSVPVRHFGAVLDWDHWHQLADSLKVQGVEFLRPLLISKKGFLVVCPRSFVLCPSSFVLCSSCFVLGLLS